DGSARRRRFQARRKGPSRLESALCGALRYDQPDPGEVGHGAVRFRRRRVPLAARRDARCAQGRSAPLDRAPPACGDRARAYVKSIEVLGCRVDGLGRDEAVARVIELARGTRPSLVVTLGTEMVMEAQHNDAFRREVNGAALSLCDTIGLLCVSRLRGGPLRTRVTGVDLVDALAYESPRAGVSLYFLGGAPGVAERA